MICGFETRSRDLPAAGGIAMLRAEISTVIFSFKLIPF
jgi:hypothetical protein